MHTDGKYLRNIPIAIKNDDGFNEIINIVKKLEEVDYLMNDWFDLLERLNIYVYNAYGLTETEVNLIDFEMKQVQSKKWLRDGI